MAVSFCVVDYLVINEFVNYSLEEFNIAKINFCASVYAKEPSNCVVHLEHIVFSNCQFPRIKSFRHQSGKHLINRKYQN